MSDMDILNQMIKDSAMVPLLQHNNKMKVELLEHQHMSSRVYIYSMPQDSIVIKVDNFKSPDTVFKGDNGECKRADYVIIADTNGKKVIIYIELKTTKGPAKGICRQLAGAKCFIAYCQEIGRTFWNEKDFLKNYQHRFVSIGHTNIRKRKTRLTRSSGRHDQPNNPLKIDWPHHIYFAKLAGN